MADHILSEANQPRPTEHAMASWNVPTESSDEMSECLKSWQTLLNRMKPDWCKAINIAAKITPLGFRLSANYMESDKPSFPEFGKRTEQRLKDLSQLKIPTLEYINLETIAYTLDSKPETTLFYKWQVIYESTRDPREALKTTRPPPEAENHQKFRELINDPRSTPEDIYRAFSALRGPENRSLPSAQSLGMSEGQAGELLLDFERLLSGEVTEITVPQSVE